MRAMIFLGALAFLGTTMTAAQMPERGPLSFEAYDKNGNGFISETEFYDVRGQRMEQRAAEGRPMRNAGNAPDFTFFDTNGDGKVTKVELLEGQNKRMQERRGGGMGPGKGRGMGGM